MVDDRGNVVSPDLVTALLGLYFFQDKKKNSSPDEKVLIDIRSSNSVGEFLEELGARPVTCPVGHAKIKKMLKEEDALFAGELTGHYYFRDNFYCDSAWITVFILLTILSKTGDRLSVLRNRIMKYSFSGEISFPLKDQTRQDNVISQLLKKYYNAEIDFLDGCRFNFPDWWFIVRKSGTEPLMRLVVETENEAELAEKIESLSDDIIQFGI